jgi:hypothetical protein
MWHAVEHVGEVLAAIHAAPAWSEEAIEFASP